MFRRRNTLSLGDKVRAIIWPKKGFNRVFNYLVQRLLRLPGSSYSIAAGVACGAAVSFTPFLGFHILLAIALAHLLRANILAAIFGTVVGNPWTFPFIFVVLYRVGTALMPLLGWEASMSDPLGLANVSGEVDHSVMTDYILPLAVGGVVMSLATWPVFFGASYLTITGWRNHKMKRRLQKQQMRKDETGTTSPESK